VAPKDAVMTQAVVMFLVLASVSVTAAVMSLGVARRLFSADHRLLPLPAAKS